MGVTVEALQGSRAVCPPVAAAWDRRGGGLGAPGSMGRGRRAAGRVSTAHA